MTAGMRLERELRHVAGVFYARLMIDRRRKVVINALRRDVGFFGKGGK
jgi:hypothetical protein